MCIGITMFPTKIVATTTFNNGVSNSFATFETSGGVFLDNFGDDWFGGFDFFLFLFLFFFFVFFRGGVNFHFLRFLFFRFGGFGFLLFLVTLGTHVAGEGVPGKEEKDKKKKIIKYKKENEE